MFSAAAANQLLSVPPALSPLNLLILCPLSIRKLEYLGNRFFIVKLFILQSFLVKIKWQRNVIIYSKDFQYSPTNCSIPFFPPIQITVNKHLLHEAYSPSSRNHRHGLASYRKRQRVQKCLECVGVPIQRYVKTQIGTLPSQAQLRHLIQALKPGSDEGMFREGQKGTYIATSRSPAHRAPGGSGMSRKPKATLPGTSKPLVRLEVRKEARARPAVSAAHHIRGTRNV